MEKWITPMVVIDKFTADQYIAACGDPANVSTEYRYIDIGSGTGFFDDFPQTWGIGDGIHQNRENIESWNGNTIRFGGPSALDLYDLDDSTHKNIYLYKSVQGREYIEPSDNYTVYVYSEPYLVVARRWYARIYYNHS